MKHGHITTEEIKEVYGYNHPPRAVRDVREHGIPIETYAVKGSDGRVIAAYRFGSTEIVSVNKKSGRTGLSKKIKKELVDKYGCKCFIYNEHVEERELQIDHRVPYEVGGDTEAEELNPDDFMLLSGSANRAKSWYCENCENWNNLKDRATCLCCYWAHPEDYTHIGMKQIRRLDIIWQGEEVAVYDMLKEQALGQGKEMPQFVKDILEKELAKKGR